MKSHRKFHLFPILTAAVACAGLCFSCDSPTQNAGLSGFKTEGGYVYSQQEPFGMTRAEAEELYAESLDEVAGDPQEGWRTQVPTELIPPENAEFLGLEWMRQLSFDGDALYLGTYTTRIEPEEFPETFSEILDAFYTEFGEGSLSQEEFQGLVDEAVAAKADGGAARVGGYWTGGDGNYLQLYTLIGVRSSLEEVVIAISGGIDRVKPFSGSQDMNSILDQIEEMQQESSEP